MNYPYKDLKKRNLTLIGKWHTRNTKGNTKEPFKGGKRIIISTTDLIICCSSCERFRVERKINCEYNAHQILTTSVFPNSQLNGIEIKAKTRSKYRKFNSRCRIDGFTIYIFWYTPYIPIWYIKMKHYLRSLT